MAINFICIVLALLSTVTMASTGVVVISSCEGIVRPDKLTKQGETIIEIANLHSHILDLKRADQWELHKNSQTLAKRFYQATENATVYMDSETDLETKLWFEKRLLMLAGSYFGKGPFDRDDHFFQIYRYILDYRLSSAPEDRIIPWQYYLMALSSQPSQNLWVEWERERLALLGLKWALADNEDPGRIESVIAIIAKNRGPDRAKLLLTEALISVPPESHLRLLGSLGWAYAFERNPNNSFRNLIGQFLPRAGVQQVVQRVIKNFTSLDMGTPFRRVTEMIPGEFQTYAVWVTDLIAAFDNEYIISSLEASAVQQKLRVGIKKGFIYDSGGKMVTNLNKYNKY